MVKEIHDTIDPCANKKVQDILENWDAEFEWERITLLEEELATIPENIWGKSTHLIRDGLSRYLSLMKRRYDLVQQLASMCDGHGFLQTDLETCNQEHAVCDIVLLSDVVAFQDPELRLPVIDEEGNFVVFNQGATVSVLARYRANMNNVSVCVDEQLYWIDSSNVSVAESHDCSNIPTMTEVSQQDFELAMLYGEENHCPLNLQGNNIRNIPSATESEPPIFYSGRASAIGKYIEQYINPDDPQDIRNWYYVVLEDDNKGWVALRDIDCNPPTITHHEGRPLLPSGRMYTRCSISPSSPVGLWETPSSDGVWGIRIADLSAGLEVFAFGNDILGNRGEVWREVRVQDTQGNFYSGWILGSNLTVEACSNVTSSSINVSLPITASSEPIPPSDFDFAMAVIDCEAGGSPQQIIDISYVIQNRIRRGGTLLQILEGGFDCAQDRFSPLLNGRGRDGDNAVLLEQIVQALLNRQDLSELDVAQPSNPYIPYGQYTYGVYVRNKNPSVTVDMPSEEEILAAIRADDVRRPICLCDVRRYLVGWTPLDDGGRSTLIFRSSASCQDATWEAEIDEQVRSVGGDIDNDNDRRTAIATLRQELSKCNY